MPDFNFLPALGSTTSFATMSASTAFAILNSYYWPDIHVQEMLGLNSVDISVQHAIDQYCKDLGINWVGPYPSLDDLRARAAQYKKLGQNDIDRRRRPSPRPVPTNAPSGLSFSPVLVTVGNMAVINQLSATVNAAQQSMTFVPPTQRPAPKPPTPITAPNLTVVAASSAPGGNPFGDIIIPEDPPFPPPLDKWPDPSEPTPTPGPPMTPGKPDSPSIFDPYYLSS